MNCRPTRPHSTARIYHRALIVPCVLEHTDPPTRLCIEVAVVSREACELAVDLVSTIKRDAPSLFTRFRGYVYQTDDDGNRIGSSQTWRHAE